MKIFGSEDLASEEVFEHVEKYMEEKLPQYKTIMVVKYSDHPMDDYLYMVEAKRKEPDKYGRGDYACWACWNESIRSLSIGYYDIESEKKCLEILSKSYREIPDGVEIAMI